MWARSLQSCHRRLRISPLRQWQRQQSTGPHKTYFQPPLQPPPKPRGRILRSVLLGTVCAAAGYVAAIYSTIELVEEFQDEGFAKLPEVEQEMLLRSAVLVERAKSSPPMDLAQAQDLLHHAVAGSLYDTSIMHHCIVPSNIPCEDVVQAGHFMLSSAFDRSWSFACLYDGHAGPRCANGLYTNLMAHIVGELTKRGCFNRTYKPDDPVIVGSIKAAFLSLDETMLREVAQKVTEDVEDRAFVTGLASLAFEGSCALVSLFDPYQGVLRVANVGDSRAVLGRWDETQQRYIAIPLSHDHTGFNPSEVARLEKEHPGERVIDPATGRVHGLAVTRAFGDTRWKWPQELSHRAHRLFFGPKPRPDEMIKTPPYLTAEPEILEAKIIETGPHPDFLIMATDGLWDHMSSENAVTCVQMWLDQCEPAAMYATSLKMSEDMARHLQAGGSRDEYLRIMGDEAEKQRTPRLLSADEMAGEYDEMADTYYDEKEKVMRWKVEPEHFVVEDSNAGVHLVKNALGGKRRSLFTQIMAVMPPNSRAVRDDITVSVWFFGQDTKELREREDALHQGEVFGDKEPKAKRKGWLW